MLVGAWLARSAASHADRLALDVAGARCSYGDLFASACAGAGQLAEQGIRAGERVALALPAGRDFAVALHACMLLGAVAVPVDLRLSAAERDAVCAGSAAVVDAPLGASGPPFSADCAARFARARHELDAVAVVIHTSGTSSAPKPVELTYGNLLWSALGSAAALGVVPNERWLCALPLSHVGGLSILVRSAIYGTTVVVHERFETERVLRALSAGEITLVSLVATTLARLLDAGLERPPALRCALTGGGPVPAALVARAAAAGVPVSITYGLTESCSQVTTAPIAAIAAGDFGAGPALFCARARCAEDGEILVAGPIVAPGALAPDGWLHTGDLGTLDEHGRLTVTGRKADTIVSGGENVAPSEVEAVLESHPDVLEAAVVGRLDERWGEAVTAIVVLRRRARRNGDAVQGDARAGEVAESAVPEIDALRAHCAAALAPYKVPKQIVLRAEPLPRTRSGKLLRREL